MSMPPPLPESHPGKPKNWWLLGCGLGLGLMVLIAAAGGLIALGVFKTIQSSGAYVQALQMAQASPELQERLGTPIRAGWYVSGSVQARNRGGEANLTIPVKGPKGSASIDYVGSRVKGKWQAEELTATIAGTGEVIDLMEDEEETDPWPPAKPR